VERANRIDRESVLLKPSHGEVPAVRRPPAVGCAAFHELVVDRMARGAVLTAWLWSTALPAPPPGIDELHFLDMWFDPPYPAPKR
jgi:hypothetical protein